MLSLGKLAPGQQQYYLDTVARGAEEYYTSAKEAPGVWVGSAADRLGLSGEVDAEALRRVLEHVDPSGVYRLTASRSVPVVAGFDVTFCAPKSVSLLYALGAPEVSNEVRNAADAAMAASLEVLEQVACRVRRGQGGHTVVGADGFVAATFRHRTSRAGDPHPHTHVVIANLAHAPSDDRWTALDGRPLYSWLSPVGHLYEAHLRWELTRRLGVEWGPVRNGIADIAGIPRPVLREFSTRRREIEAHLGEHGQHSARAAQYATYATRQAKDTSIDAEGLLPGWKARAAALGLDTDALAAVLDRGHVIEPPTPGSSGAERLHRWLASAEGLTARASTFGEREVIKAICNALPAGGRVDRVLDLVDGFLRSEHVLAVRLDRGTATIRRSDGVVISARTDEIRWTTPEMLQIEARIVTSALRRRSTGVGIATPTAVDAAVAAGRSLSVEQETMVRTICGSGDGIDIVEGAAGSGKTFALAAARRAWDASGYRVIGCSLAARAARQLQDDAGIPASTIDRLLRDFDRGNGLGLDGRTVIVVDEAAMVGTRKLARLLTRAEAARAKVVLVGDPCRLPEIDAGGAFRSLQHRLGATRLIENRRQTHTWERHGLAELRAGDTDSAVDAYLRHQRIHQAASNEEVRQLLVEHWMSARAAGEQALMVAARLADVDDLNRRARTVLRAQGGLEPDRVVLAGRPFAEGDEVLSLRNDYWLGLLNGNRAAIDRIDIDRQQIIAVTDQDERLMIPFEYAANGHLTHGYATTIHKAQGATVDRCFVLVDDTASREHAYTAVSRGRHGNDLFVVAADCRSEERHAAEVPRHPLDGLRAAVQLEAGSTSQLEQLRRQRDLLHEPQPSSMLEDLQAQRCRLVEQLGPPPPDVAFDIRHLIDDQRRAEQSLQDAERRLRQAERDLDQLGPIGRHTHRSRRREIEQRITRCNTEIHQTQAKVASFDDRLAKVAPEIWERAEWQARHADELDRLVQLDRQIDMVHRLDNLAHRSLERGLERDHGLELGL